MTEALTGTHFPHPIHLSVWTQELVRKVKESGGRFLRQRDDSMWYEISDEEAREKARACKDQQSASCFSPFVCASLIPFLSFVATALAEAKW